MPQTIPRKDVDFDEVQAVIITKTTQNLGNWMIDSSWYNILLIPAQAQWTSDWTSWQNPSIRTPLITFNKNESRKNYEPLLRKLVEMLKSSSLVTPADLKEMGILTTKDTHSPLILDFSEVDRGKTFWFSLRWENTTGKKGPWGEILNAIVP
ncbi:MAG: hypothetical protein LBJ72_14785 [Dysgonamonadaceae bacterium]|jgi:hypothetical protein|nr:hypothetical protein [Dysgonamonadaceae bacterium]